MLVFDKKRAFNGEVLHVDRRFVGKELGRNDTKRLRGGYSPLGSKFNVLMKIRKTQII